MMSEDTDRDARKEANKTYSSFKTSQREEKEFLKSEWNIEGQKILLEAPNSEFYKIYKPELNFDLRTINLSEMFRIQGNNASRILKNFVDYFFKVNSLKTNKFWSQKIIKNTSSLKYFYAGHKKDTQTEELLVKAEKNRQNRIDMIFRSRKGEILGHWVNFNIQNEILSLQKVIKIELAPQTIIIIDNTGQDIENKLSLKGYKIVKNSQILLLQDSNEKNTEKSNNFPIIQGEKSLNISDQCLEISNGRKYIIYYQKENQNFSDFCKHLKLLQKYEKEDEMILHEIRRQDVKEKDIRLQSILTNLCRLNEWNAQYSLQSLLNHIEEEEQQFDIKDHQMKKLKEEGKQCKKCDCMYRPIKKKTKIICVECSQFFGIKIFLCPECFGDFHELFKFYSKRILRKYKIHKKSRISKYVYRYLHRKNKKVKKNQKKKNQGNKELQSQLVKEQAQKNQDQNIQQLLFKFNEKLKENNRIISELVEKKQHVLAKKFLIKSLGKSIELSMTLNQEGESALSQIIPQIPFMNMNPQVFHPVPIQNYYLPFESAFSFLPHQYGTYAQMYEQNNQYNIGGRMMEQEEHLVKKEEPQ